jgi:hypothetical protein
LWLSTDENPTNKTRIAYVSGWTHPNEWTKYTSQQSIAIQLAAGRRYYIEALLKEGTGGDHLSIGWSLPDGTLERPIPGNRLFSYIPGEQFSNSQSRSEEQLQVYPNPVLERDVSELRFMLSHSDARIAVKRRIEIVGARGESIVSRDLTCESDCENGLSFQLQEPLAPGVYLITIIVDGKRFSRRVLVR